MTPEEKKLFKAECEKSLKMWQTYGERMNYIKAEQSIGSKIARIWNKAKAMLAEAKKKGAV